LNAHTHERTEELSSAFWIAKIHNYDKQESSTERKFRAVGCQWVVGNFLGENSSGDKQMLPWLRFPFCCHTVFLLLLLPLLLCDKSQGDASFVLAGP